MGSFLSLVISILCFRLLVLHSLYPQDNITSPSSCALADPVRTAKMIRSVVRRVVLRVRGRWELMRVRMSMRGATSNDAIARYLGLMLFPATYYVCGVSTCDYNATRVCAGMMERKQLCDSRVAPTEESIAKAGRATTPPHR